MANLHCSWRGNLQKLEKAGRHSQGNNLCILGLELDFFFKQPFLLFEGISAHRLYSRYCFMGRDLGLKLISITVLKKNIFKRIEDSIINATAC